MLMCRVLAVHLLTNAIAVGDVNQPGKVLTAVNICTFFLINVVHNTHSPA